MGGGIKEIIMIIHPIEPVYDENSRILILGSFPSVKSREEGFFYGHPRNRFWSVLAVVFEDEKPETVNEKKRFLLRQGVALWDVIASCDIRGSSDSSIRNVVPNDLSRILESAPIKKIFANGKTAEKMYNKYIRLKTGREVYGLPSTSPANAAWSVADLAKSWMIIRRTE